MWLSIQHCFSIAEFEDSGLIRKGICLHSSRSEVWSDGLGAEQSVCFTDCKLWVIGPGSSSTEDA